ncbi:MAG: OadG family protein [Clostridiales bacterium]|nr:OadG family protein [Clostridiales bacterium]
MLKGQTIGIGDSLLIAVVGMVVVIAILAIIAVFILLLSKIFQAVEKGSKKSKKSEKAVVSETAPASPPVKAAKPAGKELPETESQGQLKLTDVDEPTAAIIMAIVSNQSGIPLNRLSFKSIKLIEEKES